MVPGANGRGKLTRRLGIWFLEGLSAKRSPDLVVRT